ncbi:hypothetical protein [Ornithinimicrobium kibberense]|uniref:hypothetical protein n=1 Tax=Ornithinimicrobium kibberense TaxID=282060 RepID=UPI0036146B27
MRRVPCGVRHTQGADWPAPPVTDDGHRTTPGRTAPWRRPRTRVSSGTTCSARRSTWPRSPPSAASSSASTPPSSTARSTRCARTSRWGRR